MRGNESRVIGTSATLVFEIARKVSVELNTRNTQRFNRAGARVSTAGTHSPGARCNSGNGPLAARLNVETADVRHAPAVTTRAIVNFTWTGDEG